MWMGMRMMLEERKRRRACEPEIGHRYLVRRSMLARSLAFGFLEAELCRYEQK